MKEIFFRIATFLLLCDLTVQVENFNDDNSKRLTGTYRSSYVSARSAPSYHYNNRAFVSPSYANGPKFQRYSSNAWDANLPPKPFENNNFNISLVQGQGSQDGRNNIKRKSDDYDSSSMVFPETPFYKPINPNVLKDNCTFGLCDKVPDYPAEKIEKLISKSKELQQYFKEINKGQIDVHSRFGDEGTTLCKTMVYTKFPETAINLNKEEKYLVNVKDYKQGIMYEKCENDGGPCEFSGIFPVGYKVTCKQKFTVRRLMTVTKESEEAVFDNFELPSCCVCTYKNV